MISSDFEDRLREEMRQATAGVSPPSGLVRQARRAGRRRLTIGAAAAAATAAAVAVAVVVTTGAVGAPRDAGIHTTAYVVKHVESALGTTARADDIAYVHATDGYSDSWLYDGPQGVLTRVIRFSSQGQPIQQYRISQTSAGARPIFTTVVYQRKTWTRLPGPPLLPLTRPLDSCGFIPGHPSLLPPLNMNPSFLGASSLPQLTASIRQALACGQFTNEGTEHVNGVDAIKLVSRRLVSAPTIITLWVDPVTYLPVRWEMSAPGSDQPVPNGTVDITWLAPTSANLALLTVQIPPGFTYYPPGSPQLVPQCGSLC
jgi:hypothetical protein